MANSFFSEGEHSYLQEVALIVPATFSAADPRMQVFHERIRTGYTLMKIVDYDKDSSNRVAILRKPDEQTKILVVSH